jgi:hypothetical protein
VSAEDVIDERRIERASAARREPVGNPCRLGALLELAHVLLAPAAFHRNHRHEAAAGHEADEQQPPLEFRHVAGRIGRVVERTLARG